MGGNAKKRRAAKEAEEAAELKAIIMSRLRQQTRTKKELHDKLLELHRQAVTQEGDDIQVVPDSSAGPLLVKMGVTP